MAQGGGDGDGTGMLMNFGVSAPQPAAKRSRINVKAQSVKKHARAEAVRRCSSPVSWSRHCLHACKSICYRGNVTAHLASLVLTCSQCVFYAMLA